MNNASKITVPPSVASAIRHYTDLADSKSEAFTDILSMGFEGGRSEVILRHFDGNHDELMEALICGYTIEQTPEDMLREYFQASVVLKNKAIGTEEYQFRLGKVVGVHSTLDLLGIKIDGINGDDDQ